MNIADLYIRVSTDEQAEKGYSQRDQDERLRRYCANNNISVNRVIYEDHSAKSFERPDWKKYLVEIKKKSHNRFKSISVINYISNNFPPSFISAGNGDPLLPQSKSLADKLVKLNVKIDTLFFTKNLKPELPHEYQFNLDGSAGNFALKKSLAFLKELHETHQKNTYERVKKGDAK